MSDEKDRRRVGKPPPIKFYPLPKEVFIGATIAVLVILFVVGLILYRSGCSKEWGMHYWPPGPDNYPEEPWRKERQREEDADPRKDTDQGSAEEGPAQLDRRGAGCRPFGG